MFNSIWYFYLALQNSKNNVLAFISFHYAVLFFASPPFFFTFTPLFFPIVVLHSTAQDRMALAFRKAVPWKIVWQGRTLAGSSKEMQTTFRWWQEYVFPFWYLHTFTNLFQHSQDWKKPLQHLFHSPVFVPCYHSTCFSINFKKKNKHESLDWMETR